MNGLKIPFTGTQRQYKNLRSDLLAIADHVWASGRHLDGPCTLKLEEALAHRCGRKYAVAVNSGTQALIFAQRALKLPYKSKVMIPAVSFVATLNSVYEAGNKPYIVDTDDQGLIDLTSLPDPMGVYQASAVMVVNLYGNMVDYNKVNFLSSFFGNIDDLPLIEDAAQSLGASYNGMPSGSFGDVSILSFDPMKNLNNYGSGGMLLTNNEEIYLHAHGLRDNGKVTRHVLSGTNSKISELDAAMLYHKLQHFDQWQKRRKEIAEYYLANLPSELRTLKIADNVECAWHKFPVFYEHRSSLSDHLKEAGIETKVHYNTPLADYLVWNTAGASPFNPDYADYDNFIGQSSRDLCNTTLSLPIYPELTNEEVEYIVNSIIEFFNN
jgi:dTDP-4-amino-4,6-dideoxygalactose transaminase